VPTGDHNLLPPSTTGQYGLLPFPFCKLLA
jgi:hypothetical protein